MKIGFIWLIPFLFFMAGVITDHDNLPVISMGCVIGFWISYIYATRTPKTTTSTEPPLDLENPGVVTVKELIRDLQRYDPSLSVSINNVGLDLGEVPVLRQSYAAPRSPSYLSKNTVVILAGEN